MKDEYQPGTKNIAAHIGVALFSGTGLFHMVFIRPLAVGDRTGPTGAERTQLGIVLTYAGFAFVFLYALYETVAMIRMRRNLVRDFAPKRGMTTEYRASTSDIVARILAALFCGVCLSHFAFMGPVPVGDMPRRHVEGGTSFPFSNFMVCAGFAFFLVYFAYETVVMIRTKKRSEEKEEKRKKRCQDDLFDS